MNSILGCSEARVCRAAQERSLEAQRVGVKATTNERMGFLGRGEGIAALAVASIQVSE